MTDLHTPTNPEPLSEDLLEVDEASELDQAHYSEELWFEVQPEQAGRRLDAFLAGSLSVTRDHEFNNGSQLGRSAFLIMP